ncbi:MAG: HAMP domain-containing sensor histidine kinase [Bacteroidetes bacterium]|jgi:two-component system sensor histidine kinase CiaH|nr:HAMP domain-containing sensor histidine kinase [Bacteroidota bacterium]
MNWRTLKINKLKLVSIIYWLFLTYMIAAFIWWYVSLQKQNNEIAAIKFQTIQLSDPAIVAKTNTIQDFQLRKTKQFIGEGITFLLLFLLGAIYVYRSLLKQLRYADQQQNFMMAVTHELKTPIAISHLNLETLLKRDLDTTQQLKLLEATLNETKRLDSLSTNILLTSQLDMGQYEANKQEIDLSQIVRQSIKSFQERYPLRKCNTMVQDAVYIQGEPLLIQLLINNLLDNANKYAPISEAIHLNLQSNHNTIQLIVKDNGMGIPVDERAKIFEKFYRVGSENTRATKGTGLGLYLCKKITDFHSANIQLSSNQPIGSIFTVTFYI